MHAPPETEHLAADIGGKAKVKKTRKMKAGRFVPPMVGESAPSSAEPSVLIAPSAKKGKKVKHVKKAERAVLRTPAREDVTAEPAEMKTLKKKKLKADAATSIPQGS